MKTLIIITLIFICHSLNGNATRELEIGVIQFEDAKGSQIYNQLVRFDTPFAKLPQVALALVEHTSTTALFAKVKNITQQDFIIQFFSAVTLNATYRYLATTDEEVYINCSNFRATQQAIMKYPQFQYKVDAIAFLIGYHHNGFVNISINENNNKQTKLQINTNDVQQTAIGICLIVGNNLIFDELTDTPKFSGRVSSQGDIRSLSFAASIFIILLIEVQQNSEQANQEIQEPLTDLKTFFDQTFNNQSEQPSVLKKIEQNTHYSNTINQIEYQNNEQVEQYESEEQENLSFEEINLEECQEIIENDISEELSSDDLSEEEDDEYFWRSKEKEQKSSIDFELQLTLLQDALKKKPQIQQQTIKELIKNTPSNLKDQKQKTVIKKQKEIQQKNKQIDEQSKVQENIIKAEPQILNNQEIDMQLQQKESHVRSLKKALKLVDIAQEKELEIIHPQIPNETKSSQEIQQNSEDKIEQIQQNNSEFSKPIGYQSPLIDDIPKIEEVNQIKQKEKKFTQKLDSYMQSFSQDTYTQKAQKKSLENQTNKIESFQKDTIEKDQIQLIQLKGQSHSAKVVYEASEESLRKFEEDFERRKQEKMREIKQQLIPENKPTKAKFLSLAQEDESLKQYKDFFYN